MQFLRYSPISELKFPIWMIALACWHRPFRSINISNSSRSDDEVEIILSAWKMLKLQLSKRKDAAEN